MPPQENLQTPPNHPNPQIQQQLQQQEQTQQQLQDQQQQLSRQISQTEPQHIQHQSSQQQPPSTQQPPLPQQQQQPQQTQQTYQVTNNIPPNVQSPHLYQQQMTQAGQPSNYVPHGGNVPGHNPVYQVMPGLYYSNFPGNVHGYPHGLHPSYISANAPAFIPAGDAQQSHIEQVFST